jgi:lipid-binding SYLF domain-containing protein
MAMKTLLLPLAIVCLLQPPQPPLPPLFAPPAPPPTREDRVLLDAAEVLRETQAEPDRGIPLALIREAKGLVIMPGLKKVGFLFEGHFGRGIVLVRRGDGAWAPPVFCRLTGGGFGAQAGIQAQDLVLVCRTERSLKWVFSGAEITLDLNAGVSAGPVGRDVKAGTDIKLESEILAYSRSRGLFAGLAISGGRLRIENRSNADYYRVPGITTRAIVAAQNVTVTEAAVRLQQVLQQVSGAPPVMLDQPRPAGPPPR